jgi:hypothetical protein
LEVDFVELFEVDFAVGFTFDLLGALAVAFTDGFAEGLAVGLAVGFAVAAIDCVGMATKRIRATMNFLLITSHSNGKIE